MFTNVLIFFGAFLTLNQLTKAVIFTYEDVELRRLFPTEFPLDTVRKSRNPIPEHLGRYQELSSYFKRPKLKKNSHFEELVCYEQGVNKVCKFDKERFSPEEASFYNGLNGDSYEYMDRRRLYCFMLICFTVDELDRVVASF